MISHPPLRLLTSLSLLCLSSLFVSCSSSDKNAQSTASENRSFEHRVQSTKWDTSRRSSFERTAKTMKTDKEFRSGAAFRTTEYRKSGLKSFNSGKKEYGQKTYQQSNRTARVAGDTFHDANRQSRQANNTYQTNTSRFDSQQSRDANSTFRESDNVFRTRNEPSAHKAMSSNNRPYIEKFNNPSYSEDQIKSILSKD